MRILTSQLLGLLTDLLRTAHPDADAGAVSGILLHTARGHHGSEPGALELLAGISTTRRIAGHTYTPCAGQLVAPTLWPRAQVRSAITVFKAARGRDPRNQHAVEIHAGGGEVEIREDPNLIDDGIRLTFGELDAADFPARSAYQLLRTEFTTDYHDPDDRLVPPSALTHHHAGDLVPFLAVANRRGEALRLYRRHQFRPQLVQIGDSYRGILAAVIPASSDFDPERPDATVYPPDLGHRRWDPPTPATPDPATQPPTPPNRLQLDFDVDDVITKILDEHDEHTAEQTPPEPDSDGDTDGDAEDGPDTQDPPADEPASDAEPDEPPGDADAPDGPP